MIHLIEERPGSLVHITTLSQGGNKVKVPTPLKQGPEMVPDGLPSRAHKNVDLIFHFREVTKTTQPGATRTQAPVSLTSKRVGRTTKLS
jgi:hypothetical protein